MCPRGPLEDFMGPHGGPPRAPKWVHGALQGPPGGASKWRCRADLGTPKKEGGALGTEKEVRGAPRGPCGSIGAPKGPLKTLWGPPKIP